MTEYVCKCGRKYTKSTSAEVTGNRFVADCGGCPYRMPYGKYEWDETRHAMVTEVKGYECQMSQRIEYGTTYIGGTNDKTVLHVYSLDFDFLNAMVLWVKARYPNKELDAHFDRAKVRKSEYSGCGRYRLSVYPAGNKNGITAKATLVKAFFDADGHRLDMTLEEERQKILRDIECGRAAAKKKEKNMDYIISECSRNGSTYAWTRNTFWVWDKNVKKWFESGFAKELFEKAKAKDPILTETDFFTFSDDFVGMDDWEVSTEMLAALEQATKGEMAPEENPSSALCSPAEAEDVRAPALSGAAAVSLEDTQTCFDYSGLSEKTVATLHVAEKMIKDARKQYILDAADAVRLAHDELCGTVVRNSDNGKFEKQEDTFRAWCASMGISRTTAYQLLQVSELFCGSTPNEQKVLEQASPSLLYAAAKPSAPAELVQAVKDGDITSHKQYQELLAKYKAERERADALGAEVLDRDAQISQLADSCQQAETARDAAEAKARRAQEIKDVALDEVKAARAAQAEAMAEVRRVRSDLELADRKAEGYKQQVAELDQEASEMQDALDEARIENESLKAAMAAAPVAPAVVDQDEVDRRVREGVAAALADEEARWAEAVEAQQTTIRRLKETAGLAGQIKAAGEAVIAVLESLLARLDPAELDGPAVRSLDELSDTLDRYAGRLYDAVEADGPDDESEED